MRFKDFLWESNHKQHVEDLGRDYENVFDLLETHCSDAMKRFDTPIWRGFKTAYEPVYIVRGEDGGRVSKNTSNFYTILLDHFLPPEFPRRSKSIICGNYSNKEYAESFARGNNVYAVFPYDKVKIGVTQAYDLWATKAFAIGNSYRYELADWNSLFTIEGLDPSSYEAFLASVKKNIEKGGECKKWFDGLDVEEALKKAYSAENLGLEVATTENVYDITLDREVWISGPCVVINEDDWHKMKEFLA